MKIIAKKEHKDYYDSLLALGQDPAVVYHREPVTVDLRSSFLAWHNRTNAGVDLPKALPKELYEMGKLLGVYGPKEMRIKHPDQPRRELHLLAQRTLVGFCGQLYLLTEFSKGYWHYFDEMPVDERIRGYYDADKIAAAFPEIPEPSNEYYRNRATLTPGYMYGEDGMHIPRVAYRRLELLNEQNHDVLFHDIVGAPVFSLNGQEYTTNPVLKPLEFYRAVDAPQAFQRLEQYLSNNFLGVYPVPVELTEKQQVTRYGFDETYGFRTRPGTRPKRRK